MLETITGQVHKKLWWGAATLVERRLEQDIRHFCPVSKSQKKNEKISKEMTRLGFDPRTFSVLTKRDNQLHHPAFVFVGDGKLIENFISSFC